MAKGDSTQNMPNAVTGANFRPPFYQGFGQPPNSMFPSGGNSPQAGGTISGSFNPTSTGQMSIGPSNNGFQGMLANLAQLFGNQFRQGGMLPPAQVATQVQPNKMMEVPGSPGTIAPSGQQYSMLMDRYRNRQV